MCLATPGSHNKNSDHGSPGYYYYYSASSS